MSIHHTPTELEGAVGEKLKALRLLKNLDQATLAARAGISVSALKSLENGTGSTLRSLVSVIRALGRESWLDTIAPVATINPMHLTQSAAPRQRAGHKRRVVQSE
jgi:transcriptional regulator with XRE-family HTH domain